MAQLGYKFVNPSLTPADKERAKLAGIKPDGKKLPSGKVILGVNRIGALTNSIYDSVKGLKAIEEVRAISLRDKAVEERRDERDRKLDEREASTERGAVGVTPADNKKVVKEAEKDRKLKKKRGFLASILEPIWNLIKPFIKFAAIISVLKWFQDEKNQDKVRRVVMFLGEVFKFLWKWGTFGVTNLMSGLGKTFGGINKIIKGDVIGGAWDTVMGFGQLLVGFLALKGLAMFLNPFSLMGGILDMLNLLSDDTPDIDTPDKPKKPKGKVKAKTWLQKMMQRVRIMFKRMRRRVVKALKAVFRKLSIALGKLALKISIWATKLFKNVVKPLVDRLVKKALAKLKPVIDPLVDVAKGVGRGIQRNVIDPVAREADRVLKPVIETVTPVINTARKEITELVDDPAKYLAGKRKAAEEALEAGTNEAKKKAFAFFDWARNTQVGQFIEGGVKSTGEFITKTWTGWTDNLNKAWKEVTSLPGKVQNGWKALGETVDQWKKEALDKIVKKFIEPMKAGVDDFIKNTPILQTLINKFKGKPGRNAAKEAFQAFVKRAKPVVRGVKDAMDASPVKIGPLDMIIEGIFALMDLSSGVPPARVALRLGGSIAGLLAGTAILGAIGAGTGGLGAAILGGIVTGAAQFGGEWIGDRIADMLGIPTGDEDLDQIMSEANINLTGEGSGSPNLTEVQEKSAGGIVKVSHPKTGSGYQPAGATDAQGRPVTLSQGAAGAFARMMEDSGGVVRGADVASSQRSKEHNAYVGGVANSNHLYGNALDIHGGSNNWLRANGPKYGWVVNDYPGSHGGHFNYKGSGQSNTDKGDAKQESEKQVKNTDQVTQGSLEAELNKAIASGDVTRINVAQAAVDEFKKRQEESGAPPDLSSIVNTGGVFGAGSVLLQVMKALFPNLNPSASKSDGGDDDTTTSDDGSVTGGGSGYSGDPGTLAVSGSVIDKGVEISKSIMKDGGATKQAAAAIAGNMAHESAGFIPGIREGGPFGKSSKPWAKGTVGKGYGWAQWTNSRPGDRYDKFIESYGGDYNKIPTNADNYKFLMGELLTGNGGFIKKGAGTSGSWMEFKAKTDLVNATVDFRKTWERAGVAHDESRIKYAEQFLPKLSAGGKLNGARLNKKSVGYSRHREDVESDVAMVVIPKVIPMPINRVQGVTARPVVAGKSASAERFGSY